METLTIELYNSSARKLLKDLEDLNILRVVKKKSSKPKNLADKFAGKISKKTATEMQINIDKSRKEWERDI